MGKIFHPGALSGNDDDKYSWSPEGLPYFHAKEDDAIAKHAAWYDFNTPDNYLKIQCCTSTTTVKTKQEQWL